MTVTELEEIFIDQMPAFYSRDEAKAIAGLVLQHECKFTNSYYLLHKHQQITTAEEISVIRILDELRLGKPIQYVLAEADFFGLKFNVNSSVLIPRPETEELVDWVIKYITEHNLVHPKILDIGTGSGCIPIVLKCKLPLSVVYGLDVSQEALDVAAKNCELNKIEVNLLQADIFNQNLDMGLMFDIIISNPPYITESEKNQMNDNVLKHEPHLALFVPNDEPLIFYKSIAEFSRRHLSEKGCLFLEINENYADETAIMLNQKGFKTEIRKDLQGKDRFIKAYKIYSLYHA